LTSDAFLLVYDITQANSLQALEYFNQMIEVERETRLERGRVMPVCIVAGNKCDLQGMRQIPARDGLEWAKQRGYGFMETSAREMVNIEETFARRYLRRSITPSSRWLTIRVQYSCGEYETPDAITFEVSRPCCPHRPPERSRSIPFPIRARRRTRPAACTATHRSGQRNSLGGRN